MIVRGEDGAKREVKFALFDSSTPVPRPSQWGMMMSSSGQRVDWTASLGIPAFLYGVRLISETAAALPFDLYRGYGDSKREVQAGPQAALLRRPNDDQSRFTVWSYQYAALLRGNAYFYKLKVGNKLKALYPVNPSFVTPKYDGDRPMFELRDREYGPVVATVGRDRIIHIPGLTLEDPYVGISVVAYARDSIGTEVGRQDFEARYVANDASPGAVLEHPGNPNVQQRQELRSGWETRHQGNAGRLGMVWGGWKLTRAPLSLQDAQFIEAKRYSVQDVGRMLGIPSGLLNDPDAPASDSPEQENMRFLTYGVSGWLERMERGLETDLDLFPEQDWTVDADEHGFLKADIKTRFEAYRLGRQGGWLTGNEPRKWEGLDPLPGGDELQQTPVGGEANPGQSSEPGKQAESAAMAAVRDLSERFAAQPPVLPPVTNVNVDVQPSSVTVEGSDITVPGQPAAQHVFNLEMPQPVVNVEGAHVDAPVVNVTVPEQDAPVVNVDVQSPVVNVEAQTLELPSVQVDVHVPEQAALPAPVVNFAVPDAPVVNVDVHVPEQPSPEVQVDVHVPEQPANHAPVVNVDVHVPEQAAPEVQVDVHVPEQDAPVVNVDLAPRDMKVRRDRQGNITGIEER